MKNNDQEWNDEKQKTLKTIVSQCYFDGFMTGRQRGSRASISEAAIEAAKYAEQYVKFRVGEKC